ncbi:MAG: cellulase family glycosylhydrolase [Chloroflexales bacterium]
MAISKNLVKTILGAALLLAAMVAALAAVAGVANLLAFVQQGADPASALNIVPNIPPDLSVRIDRLPDPADVGRTMDPATRDKVEAAYLRAWLQWSLSYEHGGPYGLGSYFHGPALQRVSDAISGAIADGLSISQVNTSHQIGLRFFALDGRLLSFRDEDAHIVRITHDAKGNLVSSLELRAAYDVTMVEDNGLWKIYRLTQVRSAPLGPPAPAVPAPGLVARTGNQLTLDGRAYVVAGVNYYPQATPWDLFWSSYDPQLIDADMAQVASLGMNTVRIFVPYAQFGGSQVEPKMLDRLGDLLARAEAHGLKVIVTLFDFHADYAPLLWPRADRHLEAILGRFVGNPAVLAWDLKNEPDLDYQAAGRANVMAWLEHTARVVRAADPSHLITIGWSNPEAAADLTDQVDFVSFHYYAPVAQLSARYAQLRAATARPLLLGEFGLSTWNSSFFPGSSEVEQAAYTADLLGKLRATDAAGFMIWTLYDFRKVPANVAGRAPWTNNPQQHLGVLRADGTPKPVAALLAPGASLNVPRPTLAARMLKPFRVTLMIVWLLLASGIALWLVPRRR